VEDLPKILVERPVVIHPKSKAARDVAQIMMYLPPEERVAAARPTRCDAVRPKLPT